MPMTGSATIASRPSTCLCPTPDAPWTPDGYPQPPPTAPQRLVRRVVTAAVQSGTGVLAKLAAMTYIVTETCVDLKDKSCIEVCPVDCIHEADEDRMVYIDPDECIDCGACVDPCPVDAIYAEEDVPETQVAFVDINKVYFKDKALARSQVAGVKPGLPDEPLGRHRTDRRLCAAHKQQGRTVGLGVHSLDGRAIPRLLRRECRGDRCVPRWPR